MADLAELIRQAVRAVPPGTVASYGDVAELVGCHARQVGRVMATDAADSPWWRITNSQGRLPAHLLPEARKHWMAEGIDVDDDAPGVQIRRYRVDPGEWAARADLDEIPGEDSNQS